MAVWGFILGLSQISSFFSSFTPRLIVSRNLVCILMIQVSFSSLRQDDNKTDGVPLGFILLSRIFYEIDFIVEKEENTKTCNCLQSSCPHVNTGMTSHAVDK